MRHSLADGILTRDEEARLRQFQNKLALGGDGLGDNVLAQLNQASRDRLVLDARLAALAVHNAESHLQALEGAIGDSGLEKSEQRNALILAWEAAVEGALEDGLPTLDEEAALLRYQRYFGLQDFELNRNEVQSHLEHAAVIRELTEGIVPQRYTGGKNLPLNLQKSEQLVWAFRMVDYYELKTQRERRGSSHGVSIRLAKGLYYSPRTFRSQTHEWEETVKIDTGLLAVTTKHIYFRGYSKSFRVRFDKIVSFEQFNDGFGIVRDALTAKPQSFDTGDGWFVYNLVVNLARM